MNNAGGESRLKQLPGVAVLQKLHRQIFREIKTLYRVPELSRALRVSRRFFCEFLLHGLAIFNVKCFRKSEMLCRVKTILRHSCNVR